jgi:hypothetical protein
MIGLLGGMLREGEDLEDGMAEGHQVGAGEFPDVIEEAAPVEAGERGDARLAVEAHAVPVGHGDEEEVEGGGLGRESGQMATSDQSTIDPGEAGTARSGKPPDPLGTDRAVPEVASSRRARSRVAHCQISRPKA